MKKTISYILVLLCCVIGTTRAQDTHFISKGTIIYERRTQIQKSIKEFVDLHPYMKGRSTEIMNMFNQKYKPFQVTTYQLEFTPTKSYYAPTDTQPSTHQEFDQMFNMPGNDNAVFSDYNKHMRLSTKSIFGTTLNISDSMEAIKWRITDETREIAGFECRRANGLIHDSVYVVAFYTTQITPSMGPESFYGLPGMVMGLSLPYLHSTWMATKVFDTVDESKIADTRIKKNKTVSEKEFQSSIRTLANNMGGQEAGNYIIQYLNF